MVIVLFIFLMELKYWNWYVLLKQFKQGWASFLPLYLESGKEEVCSFFRKFSKLIAQKLLK